MFAYMVTVMKKQNFRDEHVLKGAFVSNTLLKLVDLIALQGDDLLHDAGIIVPSRAVACALFVGDKGRVSLADVAKALDEPHQLTAHRVEGLIGLGLLERISDSDDRRRKILMLTRKGKVQHQRLITRLAEIEQAFLGLYAEIEHDLPTILEQALAALHRTPMLERIQANATKTGEPGPKEKAR